MSLSDIQYHKNEKIIHTMKLGLIGHPILHSQSPRLFKELRPDWQYDLIETSDFEKAISIFKASYDAINVTAPFKELAFKTADIHDALCAQVGATNLLVKENGLIKAYNTDVFGVQECLKECVKKHIADGLDSGLEKCFLESMEGSIVLDSNAIGTNDGVGSSIGASANVDADGCVDDSANDSIGRRADIGMYKGVDYSPILPKVIVIGCSGAGKAATVASLEMGLPTTITNRDEQKAIDLKGRFPDLKIAKTQDLRAAIKANDIIIYTLPVTIPELSKIDFTKKTIIEANYRSPALFHYQSRLYIGGKLWLRKQAEAAAEIIISQL